MVNVKIEHREDNYRIESKIDVITVCGSDLNWEKVVEILDPEDIGAGNNREVNKLIPRPYGLNISREDSQ